MTFPKKLVGRIIENHGRIKHFSVAISSPGPFVILGRIRQKARGTRLSCADLLSSKMQEEENVSAKERETLFTSSSPFHNRKRMSHAAWGGDPRH